MLPQSSLRSGRAALPISCPCAFLSAGRGDFAGSRQSGTSGRSLGCACGGAREGAARHRTGGCVPSRFRSVLPSTRAAVLGRGGRGGRFRWECPLPAWKRMRLPPDLARRARCTDSSALRASDDSRGGRQRQPRPGLAALPARAAPASGCGRARLAVGPAFSASSGVAPSIDTRAPASGSRPANASLVNWLPWSVLKISGLGYASKASSSASVQKRLSSVFDSRHDSTQRLAQSIIVTSSLSGLGA